MKRGKSDSDPWDGLSSVERARMRARGRSRIADLGMTEEELAAGGISLEAAGCVARPHEILPYRLTEMKALGKKLAREHGW